jgi:signal transduction histidine kinase
MNKEEITFEDLKIRTANFIDNARTAVVGIKFEFNFPNKDNGLVLNSKQGIEIYRIIQEAVNNAIKHANATIIRIDFNKLDTKTTIAINDNGTGFDTTTIEAGNGLNSMKKRAKSINSEIVINSSNSGTSVSLIFMS